jgi:hypothetical protein
MTENPARAAILEIQVNAGLAGHDLGPFEPVDTFAGGGYEARCRRCDLSAWVGESGMLYSLFGEKCQK